jgi:hypothetical protein
MRTVHTSYSSHTPHLAAVTLALLVIGGLAPGAQPSPQKSLPDGTVLRSIDGTLLRADTNDRWRFELSADANSVNGAVAAGTQLELLPCATLEMLIADMNDRYTPAYRLSARVTLYKGKNFLFPTYFLPLSGVKGATASPEEQPRVPHEIVDVGKSDPELAIPPEVLEKLRERPAAREPQREGGNSNLPKKPARMVVDVLGTVRVEAEGAVFTPNAFGWNVGPTRYRLLPCGVLEQILRQQAVALDPIRFNVAGLVTEFRGDKYLLLQRAIRTYDYGNFGG